MIGRVKKNKVKKIKDSTKFALGVIFIGGLLYFNMPEEDKKNKDERLGRAITIEMPNGVTISTYEKFVKFEDGKVYLISDAIRDIEVTEGELKYE